MSTDESVMDILYVLSGVGGRRSRRSGLGRRGLDRRRAGSERRRRGSSVVHRAGGGSGARGGARGRDTVRLAVSLEGLAFLWAENNEKRRFKIDQFEFTSMGWQQSVKN